jgi:hypothetical protein
MLDEYGRPLDRSEVRFGKLLREWGKMLDENGPPPWVRPPENPRLRPIVDHVNVLTRNAYQLLFRVLERQTQIPADIAEEIREWEEKSYGYGWIRWLWYATPIRDIRWCRNYAQAAATALLSLRDAAAPPGSRATPGRARSRGRRQRTPEQLARYRDLKARWERAKNTGVQKGQFCQDNNISLETLETALRTCRKAARGS